MSTNILNISIPPETRQTGFLDLLDNTCYAPGDPAAEFHIPINDLNSSGWNLNIPVPILQSTALDVPSHEECSPDINSSANYVKDDIIHRLKGKKGGDQIGLNGYVYTHEKQKQLSGGQFRHYWQCTMRGSKKLNCTARLITSVDEPISVIREASHSHEPDPTQIKVTTVKTRCD